MSELVEVWPEFEFLPEMGMRYVASQIDRSGFCNAILILAGPYFTMHLNRDRGGRYVVIGVTPSDLHGLTNVIELVKDQILIEPVPLKVLAQLTMVNWSALEMCFKNPVWLSSIAAYSKKKGEAWFESLEFKEPGI